jgi:hypothetical protein
MDVTYFFDLEEVQQVSPIALTLEEQVNQVDPSDNQVAQDFKCIHSYIQVLLRVQQRSQSIH